MKAFLIAAAIVIASLPAQGADDYLGVVTGITDGDTFNMKVGTKRMAIRLCGIDSPERGEPGYGAAAGTLADMVEGKVVHCLQVGLDTPCDGRSKSTNQKRIVAQCFVGDRDVAMEMVRAKRACDWPHFSRGHYKISEDTCVRQGK